MFHVEQCAMGGLWIWTESAPLLVMGPVRGLVGVRLRGNACSDVRHCQLFTEGTVMLGNGLACAVRLDDL